MRDIIPPKNYKPTTLKPEISEDKKEEMPETKTIKSVKKKRGFLKFFIILLILAILGLGGAFAYLYYLNPSFSIAESLTKQKEDDFDKKASEVEEMLGELEESVKNLDSTETETPTLDTNVNL